MTSLSSRSGWLGISVDGDSWFRQFGINPFAESCFASSIVAKVTMSYENRSGVHAQKRASMSAAVAPVAARWFRTREEPASDVIGIAWMISDVTKIAHLALPMSLTVGLLVLGLK